jgi:hypothetical protein
MSYLNNDERPSYEMPPINSKNIELQSSGVASAALCYGSPASADLCQKKRYFLRPQDWVEPVHRMEDNGERF